MGEVVDWVLWILSVAVFTFLGVAVHRAVFKPEVLRARRIEVVDAAGRPRIGLVVTPEGSSGLALWDAAGQMCTMLAAGPDGTPFLSFWDAAERGRILLGFRPDGTVGLSLGDDAERTRIRLVVDPDGTPELSLLDAAGGGAVPGPVSGQLKRSLFSA